MGKHVAALCPFEGAADLYRDMTHRGMSTTFWDSRYGMQSKVVQ